MKLWIDDLRPIPETFDIWAKNYDQAIMALKSSPITHISFDHDLGDDEKGTGNDVAKWIEEQAYLGNYPKIKWRVHSDNPAGVKNIIATMESADRYWDI